MISFCVIFFCVSLCFFSCSPHSVPPLQFLLEARLPLSHALPGVQLTKHICPSSSSHDSHKSLVSTPHWHRMIPFRLVELCVSTWSNLTWLVFVVNLFLESNIFRASCLFQLSFEFCICFLQSSGFFFSLFDLERSQIVSVEQLLILRQTFIKKLNNICAGSNVVYSCSRNIIWFSRDIQLGVIINSGKSDSMSSENNRMTISAAHFWNSITNVCLSLDNSEPVFNKVRKSNCFFQDDRNVLFFELQTVI